MWKRIIAFCSWRFFFFWKNLEILNFSMNWKFWLILFFFEKFGSLEFFQGIENFDWFFFFFWKQPKKYEPNASSPKAFFWKFPSSFSFLFFFWKDLERIDFFFFENFVFCLFFFFLVKYEDLFIIKKLKKMKIKLE